MIKLIAILVVGLVLEAIGVVLISHGLHEIGSVKNMSAGEIGRIIAWRLHQPLHVAWHSV